MEAMEAQAQAAQSQLLSPSGEVAIFVDDDQFGFGQSQDKCGPEAVSVVWHSVAPGQHNSYTPAEVHQMAHDDYVKFIGPDTDSDHNGTGNQTLYDMLKEHGFQFEEGPTDINWIKARLGEGKPVIIGITESSVVDNGLGANPYNWNTTGLSHVIVASGAGRGGEILCRDTANIDHNGIVRPGPRHYDANRLQLISATAVHPNWITNPPPPPAPDPDAAVKAAWSGGGLAKAPYVAGHGIPDSYAELFQKSHFFGFPVEAEQNAEENGVKHVRQGFSAAYADWNSSTGKTSWSTPGGLVEN